MEKADNKRFAQVMTGLSVAFDKEVSATLMEIYFNALSDIPIELVEKAAMTLHRSARFFPKPVEFREICEGTFEEQIQNAWNLLNKAYRKAGEMDSVCFQDHALAYAVLKTFTTWTNCANELYNLKDEMLAFKKKEFGKNYKLGQRMADSSTPLYFPGKTESSNRQSVGTWKVQMEEYRQPVYLVGDTDVIEKLLPFSGSTGQLTASGARQLDAFREGRQIESTKYRLLTKGDAGPV